jgi:glucose-1-phosphate thymidylyltransferase
VKGIILAGGSGTRLAPLTLPTSKQLLPVYDKPMIYYPLSTLMLAGIREILIITTPHEQDQFKRLLKDGSQWGINLTYEVQPEPKGLAEAFIIGEEFISGQNVALILGDNIFYGEGMGTALSSLAGQTGASIFGYRVANPNRYGVLEISADGTVTGIEEKPEAPKSNIVIPGLYFLDATASSKAKALKPSLRGELEIVDLLKLYLTDGQLKADVLSANKTWLDTGTFDSLIDAAIGVRKIEERVGKKINVPEEVAWRLGYITSEQLVEEASKYQNSGYGDYLLGLLA